MYSRFRYGFTLIELLVVIAIIGILASVVLVSLNSARDKARDNTRLAQAREITKALELFYADNGNYPSSADTFVEAAGYQTTAACNPDAGWDDDDCEQFIPALYGDNVRGDNPSGTFYLGPIRDPSGGDGLDSVCAQPGFAYAAASGGSDYTLVVGLEGNAPSNLAGQQCDQNTQTPNVACVGATYVCFSVNN